MFLRLLARGAKHRAFFLLFATFYLFITPALAQQSSQNIKLKDDYDGKKFSMAGLDYLDDNVYLGRKDATPLPYLSAYVGHQDKWGFFYDAMISYVPSLHSGHIDLLNLQAGFDGSVARHVNIGAEINHYIYYSKHFEAASDISFNSNIYINYNNKWVSPQIDGDINIGEKANAALGLSLFHEFLLLQRRLSIEPAAACFASDGVFDYYSLIKSLRGKSFSIYKDAAAENGKFQIMDCEFTVPVTYRIHHWMLVLNPTYAIPVNPYKIYAANGVIKEEVQTSSTCKQTSATGFDNYCVL